MNITFEAMKFICGFTFLLSMLIVSCGKKTQEKTSERVFSADAPQEDPATNELNTVIIAQLTTVDTTNIRTSFCETTPCKAKAVVFAISQIGKDFDGWFEEQDTITLYFQYGFQPSEDQFTELYPPLMGLKKGNSFQAELKQSVADGGSFHVSTYKKLN
ncbi:MAG: hypothetical protein WEC59_01930 [Salibacteraceae bacterium]